MEENEQRQDWYFTFGHGQMHGPNGYTKIYGTRSSARERMFEMYGPKFAFQYPNAAEAGVERFNLHEVK